MKHKIFLTLFLVSLITAIWGIAFVLKDNNSTQVVFWGIALICSLEVAIIREAKKRLTNS